MSRFILLAKVDEYLLNNELRLYKVFRLAKDTFKIKIF